MIANKCICILFTSVWVLLTLALVYDHMVTEADFMAHVHEHIKQSDRERLSMVDIQLRDDAILNKFLGGEWDRSKCVMLFPEELLADGSIKHGIQLVDCDKYDED